MVVIALEQVSVDDGDSPYDLADALDAYSGESARPSVVYEIRNTGTVTAYVGHADDTPPTAMEIPPGELREAGPFLRGSAPTLFMASGAACLVTPLVSP